MITTLRTLWLGEAARAEGALRARHAPALIDQKLREAEAALRSATGTLAALVQRERAEIRLRDALAARHSKLEEATRAAILAGDDALARQGAVAIVEMRAEAAARAAVIERLAARTLRLRASVEKARRRLVELRHGAMQARAVRREHDAQSRLGGLAIDPAREADALIRQVLEEEDPLERAEIVAEIEAGAPGRAEAGLMAAGHLKGAPRPEDIIAELSAPTPKKD